MVKKGISGWKQEMGTSPLNCPRLARTKRNFYGTIPLLFYCLFSPKVVETITRKLLHEKMLKIMNLYWFHNSTSEKNNSINSHSNEPRINEERLATPPVKWYALEYFYDLYPSIRHTAFSWRNDYFKNSFFLSVINVWNKLHPKIYNSTPYISFRDALINVIRSPENKIFNIHE